MGNSSIVWLYGLHGIHVMVLTNLTKEQLELIYNSIKINPTVKEGDKVITQKWIKLQLDEQVKGGPWKARIRGMGFVI